MERLTERTAAGVANINYSGCYFDDGMRDKIAESARRQTVIERLASIEDILGEDYDLDRLRELVEADRDGRYLALPCKVGDVVYTITKVFNGVSTELKIGERLIDGYSGNLLNPIWVISKEPYELHFYLSEFGKTVFLTFEAAEAALKGGAYGG